MAKQKSKVTLADLVRQFQDTSSKWMLFDEQHLEELLRILESEFHGRIDFSSLDIANTDFINVDFRNFRGDLVLTTNLLDDNGNVIQKVIIYILVEAQSEPEELMIFWVMLYMMLIWLEQLRVHESKHKGERISGFKFHPVLPIVFYAGSRTWRTLGNMEDLVEFGNLFSRFIPSFSTLFLNLPEKTKEELLDNGGNLGAILYLLQSSHRKQ